MLMASNTDIKFEDHTKVMGSWNRGPDSAETQASLVARTVKDLPAMRRPGFDPWVGKILWRRER